MWFDILKFKSIIICWNLLRTALITISLIHSLSKFSLNTIYINNINFKYFKVYFTSTFKKHTQILIQ